MLVGLIQYQKNIVNLTKFINYKQREFMDRKLILYLILGAILFVLWNEWQKDYNKPTPVVATAAPTTSVTSNTVSASITATDNSVANSVTAKSNTLPISATTPKVISKIPEDRLIKVHTDVLDLAIDRVGGDIVKTSLLKYPETLGKPKPVELLSDDPDNFYVAESGLISKEGPDISQDKPAKFTASKKEYTLEPGQNNLSVTLVWSNGKGLVINKVFTFSKEKYTVKVNYVIENKSNRTWDGQFYTQLKRLYAPEKKSMFRFSTFAGAAISSPEKPYEKISYADLTKENLDRNIQGGWCAIQQRYFLSVWVPDQNKTHHYYSSVNTTDNLFTIGMVDSSVSVPAGQKITIGATLYSGPEITENLAPLANGLDRTIDYGWLYLISMGLFWVMKKIYLVVHNWGVAIILLTVLIKAVFYKLSETSCRSMARMRELGPKIQSLKERYGDDKQKLSQATMELYKKEHINPLGGCLPMLIQIPFFIALYYVLMNVVELRQAPFVFWIRDLSAQDPYYVLPILMGASMYLQQKLSPSSPDPMQAKMFMLMPVIFTVFFLSFPSGLVLYWLVNSCLSVLQQWYINKKLCAPKKHHKT